ncbi:MAG: deoxyribose-phosphate aldolase [Planctomycetia bacterium]|nr:deoxyribose-phosphate aldolase [Planctomycetia bacterium]
MERSLSKYIDHTILKAFAGKNEIETLCNDAKKYDFASVCINPSNIPLAKKLLAGTDVKVCTVIGFPLGANTTAIKVAETEDALKMGCDEFDMVINVGALKDKRDDYVRDEIRAVVKAAQGRLVKVIIETFFLNDEEKVRAVKLSCEAGASFVKTCTGFNDGKATVDDVRLMKANATNGVQVKASSGIRTWNDAKALIDAGAERLGTSSGATILAEYENSEKS